MWGAPPFQETFIWGFSCQDNVIVMQSWDNTGINDDIDTINIHKWGLAIKNGMITAITQSNMMGIKSNHEWEDNGYNTQPLMGIYRGRNRIYNQPSDMLVCLKMTPKNNICSERKIMINPSPRIIIRDHEQCCEGCNSGHILFSTYPVVL